MELNPHVEDVKHAHETEPPLTGPLTRFNATVARLGMYAAVAGLLVIVGIVFYQVFGRYVLNSSPTWTESLALILVLYVTLIAAAVGVRDAGHIGMESLVSLLPTVWRHRLELLIHALVALFGGIMVWSGWQWTVLKWSDIKPMLAVPVGADYLALVIAGVLVVLFSIEHIIALVRGEEVVPSWN